MPGLGGVGGWGGGGGGGFLPIHRALQARSIGRYDIQPLMNAYNVRLTSCNIYYYHVNV